MMRGHPVFMSMLLLPVTMILFGCIKEETTPITPTAIPISDIEVLSVKEHFDDALIIAQQWQSDAYLQSASANVRQNDGFRTLRITYDFLSDKKRSEALLVWIREDKTIDSKVVDLAGSTEDRREVKAEQWLLDGVEAFQIAQEYGGSEYISKYGPVEIDIFLEYYKQEPNNTVIWRVS